MHSCLIDEYRSLLRLFDVGAGGCLEGEHARESSSQRFRWLSLERIPRSFCYRFILRCILAVIHSTVDNYSNDTSRMIREVLLEQQILV